MATFTVHAPPAAAPENIILVRDGFSGPAFVFGPFWLAWRRAWIPALGWGLLLALLSASTSTLGPLAPGFVSLAASLALGFEGPEMVRWSLARKGYAEQSIVLAESPEEAEEVFFHRRAAAAGEQPA